MRMIREGDSYEDGENVELDQVLPYPEPPIEIQGEPMGWTKPGRKPRGWRESGDYGS